MYGMSDAIREYQEDARKLDNMVTDLKNEVIDKDSYIISMEYALTYILDWYWNIDEPGLVPDSLEFRGILKYINKVLKQKRRDR
jgi:hypothetical protein